MIGTGVKGRGIEIWPMRVRASVPARISPASRTWASAGLWARLPAADVEEGLVTMAPPYGDRRHDERPVPTEEPPRDL